MLGRHELNTREINQEIVLYEIDKEFLMSLVLSESDKKISGEKALEFLISSVLERQDKVIRGENALEFLMSFTDEEKDKTIQSEKGLEFLMSSSFKPFSMRNDIIVEGIKNIVKPQQGQIEVIAE